jgi:type II secretory pathway pseudopilin PulG
MTMRHDRRQARRSGFTLTEVVLALVLTGMIGLAVLLMLSGLSSATTTQTDVRRLGVKRQLAADRIGTRIRAASRVLGVSDGALVLWKSDANASGDPNLSELLLIRWESGSAEVLAYEAPIGLDPLDDAEYELTENFVAIADGLAGSASFPGACMLRGVAGLSLLLDDADVQLARRVRVQADLEAEGGGTSTATFIASLRAG